MRSRRGAVSVAVACVSLSFGSAALAAWSSSGSGTAAGRALTMPAGSSPTVGVSGATVTVRWPAATFSTGAAVEGYIVKRVDTTNGAEVTVGGSCAGVVASTSCSETLLPAGTWVYTDTPAQGAWRGAASAPSNIADTH